MLDIKEIEIKKYRNGTHPHQDGILIFSRFVLTSKYNDKAVYRLLKYIESKEQDLHKFEKEYIYIKTEPKNASFNYPMETVEKDAIYNGEKQKADFKRKIELLERSYPNSNFYISYDFKDSNGFVYMLSTRDSKLFDTMDKEKMIRNKSRGIKAAITRNKNKMQKIINDYTTTLMPDEYISDLKYISLSTNLPKQEARLKESQNLTIADIPDSSGRFNKMSLKSLLKLKGTLNAKNT